MEFHTFQSPGADSTADGKPANAGPRVASYASSWSHALADIHGRLDGFCLAAPPPRNISAQCNKVWNGTR